MIRLEPMGTAEFAESLAAGVRRRAVEQVERGIWARAVAEEVARDEFSQLLPAGQSTPHFRFCKILDVDGRRSVGETWYSIEPTAGRPRFWVHWPWIEPACRRRGFATAVLRKLEEEAIRAGADRIGLHVVADNTGALALYSSLGFETTDLRLSKTLGGGEHGEGRRGRFTTK